jgi:hypothetical protein
MTSMSPKTATVNTAVAQKQSEALMGPPAGKPNTFVEGAPSGQLTSRRDALLRELEDLEKRRRAGTVNSERYEARRERLITDLEQIYGELDDADRGPQGGGEGIAA